MLVLSRKIDESVWIDGSIRVRVLEISGGHVKLGFSAPKDVVIQREEIRDVYPVPFESWNKCSALEEVCT